MVKGAKFDTHMATKLGANPVGSRINAIVTFAASCSLRIVPLRLWKYALLIVSICWHYHFCTCLQCINFPTSEFRIVKFVIAASLCCILLNSYIPQVRIEKNWFLDIGILHFPYIGREPKCFWRLEAGIFRFAQLPSLIQWTSSWCLFSLFFHFFFLTRWSTQFLNLTTSFNFLTVLAHLRKTWFATLNSVNGMFGVFSKMWF